MFLYFLTLYFQLSHKSYAFWKWSYTLKHTKRDTPKQRGSGSGSGSKNIQISVKYQTAKKKVKRGCKKLLEKINVRILRSKRYSTIITLLKENEKWFRFRCVCVRAVSLTLFRPKSSKLFWFQWIFYFLVLAIALDRNSLICHKDWTYEIADSFHIADRGTFVFFSLWFVVCFLFVGLMNLIIKMWRFNDKNQYCEKVVQRMHEMVGFITEWALHSVLLGFRKKISSFSVLLFNANSVERKKNSPKKNVCVRDLFAFSSMTWIRERRIKFNDSVSVRKLLRSNYRHWIFLLRCSV